jgi:ATP-dependent Clp protease ATP-binding subunit ClpA
VKCGANLDLRGWDSNGSARQIARELWENGSHGPSYRRVVELCGLDPDAILAERDARPLPVPVIDRRLSRALDDSAVDARHMGQDAVREENLLFGLLRSGELPLLYFTQQSGMDRDRFYADVKSRVGAVEELAERASFPLHTDAQQLVDAAVALAAQRRKTEVYTLHLLYVLIADEQGIAARLLAQYGGSATRLREELKRAI